MVPGTIRSIHALFQHAHHGKENCLESAFNGFAATAYVGRQGHHRTGIFDIVVMLT
jgi:hypothetical protein